MTKKIDKNSKSPDQIELELKLQAQKAAVKLVQQSIKSFPSMNSIDQFLQLVNNLVLFQLKQERRINELCTELQNTAGELLLAELGLKAYKKAEPPPSVG